MMFHTTALSGAPGAGDACQAHGLRDGEHVMMLPEFDARTARAMRRALRAALPFGVSSALCLLAALLYETGRLPGPGEMQPVAAGGFLGLLVLALLAGARAGRRAERAEGLMCPACGHSLVGGAYAYRTTFVRAKGRCPTCRTRVIADPLEPDEMECA